MTGARRWVALAVAWLPAIVLAAPASAQAATLDVTGIRVADHPKVTVEVAAPTSLIGIELQADDFEVIEDGLRRGVVLRRLPTDDLAVVLAIDTSGSMAGAPLVAAREAAKTFLEAMPASVRVAVVGFGSQASTASDFTADRAALIAAIDGLRTAGETAMNDGLALSAGLFGDGAGTRSIVVLLSDGGETASTTSAVDATAALRERGVTVEVVALETAESDLPALAQLVSDTAGHMATTTDPDSLAALFAGIAGQLVNRYALTYTSASQGEVELTVRLAHEGVTATSSRVMALPLLLDENGEVLPSPVLNAAPSSWVATVWAPRIGLLAVFVGLTILFVLLRPQESRKTRMTSKGRWVDRVPLLGRASDRALQAANRHLDQGERRSALDRTLERAGVSLRPAEFIVFVACATAAVVMVVFLAAGPIVAVLLGLIVSVGIRVVLNMRASRRLSNFTEQLPDTLQVLAGSLRAGHGLVQAIDAVSRQGEEPTAGEFHRVLTEVRLGRDLDRALDSLAERIDVDDLEWVVQAMQIHREVGGDLAEVLETVAGTVRERAEVRGQIKALTAQGRLSATIMFILPFFMAGAIAVVKPGYLGEFTTHPVGYLMLGFGSLLMLAGALWTKRLIRLVF